MTIRHTNPAWNRESWLLITHLKLTSVKLGGNTANNFFYFLRFFFYFFRRNKVTFLLNIGCHGIMLNQYNFEWSNTFSTIIIEYSLLWNDIENRLIWYLFWPTQNSEELSKKEPSELTILCLMKIFDIRPILWFCV